MPRRHNRVNIRKTHPLVFRLSLAVTALEVLLAFNYWWYTPTFNPFDIPKNLVGAVFFALGVSHLLVVNVDIFRRLRWLRIAQSCSAFALLVWGAFNTQQVFNGRASWALPLLLIFAAVVQLLLVREPPVNLTTKKKLS